MIKGKRVTVRLFGGGTETRRLLDVKGEVVVICHEDEFNAAQREGRQPSGLGFPREDVIDEVSDED